MFNPEIIEAFILDDEPTACANLSILLSNYSKAKIKIIGTAHSTAAAEPLLRAHPPQVLFLDIQMPNENAFSFIERFGEVNFEIIFITAYDEFALRAFKLNAIDYILKPINIGELHTALERLMERLEYLSYTKQKEERRELDMEAAKKPHQIILRNGHLFEAVPFKDIIYLEAMGNYTRFFFYRNGEEHNIMMGRSITEYEELLPDDMFIRSHKSFIIHYNFVQSISKSDQLTVTLHNGKQLPIARRRFSRVVDFLKNQLSANA